MFLKSLHLTNFRNYSDLSLTFDNISTILIGNNAEGKSNLLEAVYLLSTGKSWRAETEEELIKKSEAFGKVEGSITEDGQKILTVIINKPSENSLFKKKVMVNGIPKRVIDFIGNLPAVIFHPSDINMVTGSPSLRRWHLDISLAQIDPVYKKALTAYEQFLVARNRVLKRIKEGQGRLDELDYWTTELVDKGDMIQQKRQMFFNYIKDLKTPLGEFVFGYKQSLITLEKLQSTINREIAAASTLIGPHRDDYTIFLENRNLASFGSRGEQRTGTLAFKLGVLEYMAINLGKRPILLLDDVFSELDANHRACVIDIVNKQQTIIATVELEHIPEEFLNSVKILKVEKGKIF